MPMTTQYTTLLLDLEQLDHHMQDTRKESDHDKGKQDTCHRPVQFGGHGGSNTTEGRAQVA